MQASVVGPKPGPSGSPKASVFKNTVIFVPADSPEEAAYLAALLNSRWANYLLRASNVRGGKSAFATNVLHALRIAVFDRDDDLHMRLSDLGRLAAEQAAQASQEMDHTEYLVDEAAGQYWDLSDKAKEGMHEVLDEIR